MPIKKLSRYFLLPLLANATCALADADWQYGGAIDLSYASAFQTDDEIRWRGKATTTHLNEFSTNMGMAYLRKLVSESSRWGVELGAQAGYDTDGQVPASQRLSGADTLRYLARANVSYLAPVGKGLLLTAGLMNSFIGFESLYAKDNPNYTRSWIADYSPYFLIGVGGQYTINQKLTAGFYLVSDYDYLAHRNNQPKYASQLAWAINPEWKLTQNLFAGPEQRNTETEYWRYFSDTIVQWTQQDLMLALAYDVGTERLAQPGQPQILWMGSALFSRWHIAGPWSLALRPEIYWDGDGRLTGSRQLIKAVTTTVEYKIPFDDASFALRGEYRYDESTGSGGGFFKSADSLAGLTHDQHLVLFSCLLTLDKP